MILMKSRVYISQRNNNMLLYFKYKVGHFLLLVIICFFALTEVVADLPDSQIVGINYGPFRDGQDPINGPYPTEEQIREDLTLIKSISDIIRIYSMDESTDEIIDFAKEEGLQVVLGAWLGSDEEQNDLQWSNQF